MKSDNDGPVIAHQCAGVSHLDGPEEHAEMALSVLPTHGGNASDEVVVDVLKKTMRFPRVPDLATLHMAPGEAARLGSHLLRQAVRSGWLGLAQAISIARGMVDVPESGYHAQLVARTLLSLVDEDVRKNGEKRMNIAGAYGVLKSGKKVARTGWNGKGMWIVLQRGYPEGIPINRNTAEATGLPEGSVERFLPYVIMRTSDGAFVPWLCSQSDFLAEDWEVVS